MQELAVQAQKAESDLRQKILRENAELAKSANIREERLQHLTMHRQRTKEDHHLYKEVKKVTLLQYWVILSGSKEKKCVSFVYRWLVPTTTTEYGFH